MKPPYIKKDKKIGKINVWIVDGNYIRTNIDEEFTNFGHHYRFKFIPENEIWIDRENSLGEEKYYIEDMITFIKCINRGKDYKEASELGEKRERDKRNKSLISRKTNKKLLRGGSVLDKVYKKQIFQKYNPAKIWIVNGEIVRDLFFIDFTEGGHDKVYHFIPKGEIWIDDDLSKKEILFVLLHEAHERSLMAKGWKYERAHIDSSRIELFCRHYPKKTKKMIEKELKNFR